MIRAKIILFVLMACLLLVTNSYSQGLNYFEIYKPKEGMSAEEIMRIKYFVKYTLFAKDYESTGYAYFIDKTGSIRERTFLRRRLILGRASDGISYKDLVLFTSPTVIKGLGILSWMYIDPKKEADQWLWLPSLKRIRKVSQAQADDSFLGSDFTVEEITTRRFEDETYQFLREEKFKGFTSEFNKKTYHKDTDCFVIEARPKKSPWYYSKRIVWIDKNTGGDIFHEIYDPKGRLYKIIFKNYEILNVSGRDYATQTYLEVKDLRTEHKTVIEMRNIKFDQGLSEDLFTTVALMQSRW
jgi:hypothetical protein